MKYQGYEKGSTIIQVFIHHLLHTCMYAAKYNDKPWNNNNTPIKVVFGILCSPSFCFLCVCCLDSDVTDEYLPVSNLTNAMYVISNNSNEFKLLINKSLAVKDSYDHAIKTTQTIIALSTKIGETNKSANNLNSSLHKSKSMHSNSTSNTAVIEHAANKELNHIFIQTHLYFV